MPASDLSALIVVDSTEGFRDTEAFGFQGMYGFKAET